MLPDFDAILGGEVELVGGLDIEKAIPVVEEADDAVNAVVVSIGVVSSSFRVLRFDCKYTKTFQK